MVEEMERKQVYEQYLDPDTDTSECKSVIINIINYTCSSPYGVMSKCLLWKETPVLEGQQKSQRWILFIKSEYHCFIKKVWRKGWMRVTVD